MNNSAVRNEITAYAANDNAEGGMVIYEAALRAVAAAKSVDEVKEWHNKSAAMRAYAKQAKNKQLETDAAEIRIRAERRLGEMMAAQRDAGLLNRGTAGAGNPEWLGGLENNPPRDSNITLSEVGIDKNLADRARKTAAIPETEFEGIVQDWRDRIEQENERVSVNILEAGNKHVRGTLGTGENEWYTPARYIELARSVLGGFDVDPASNPIAQSTVNAGVYYTEETNGLDKEWNGKVWMNPPYAQPAISHFSDKMVDEYTSGRCTEAIVLTHNYTDTAWHQHMSKNCAAICLPKGRIRFESPTGEKASPTQGQTFFYFGGNIEAFRREFSEIGIVWVH